MADKGLVAFRGLQAVVGERKDKADRHISFVDDIHTFINQHKRIISAIKAEYGKPLNLVTDADIILNFGDSVSEEVIIT